MPRIAVFFLIFMIIAFVFISLGRQIADAISAGDRLDDAVSELTDIQKKNKELKDRLVYVQSPEFIEEAARDKLNMAKPGEVVVVIPNEEIQKVLGLQNQVETKIELPNWQAWLRLFFPN